MATAYQDITDRFLNKAKKFKTMFVYKNLEDADFEEVIYERAKVLLDDACLYLSQNIFYLQNVDFEDRDDDMEIFNFTLTKKEENLLSEIMLLMLYEEEKNKFAEKQAYLGTDIKLFSPSAERKTFMDMLIYVKNNTDSMIEAYNTTDRLTGRPLLPTGSDDIDFE